MIRTIIWFIMFWVYQLISLVFLLIYKLMKNGPKKEKFLDKVVSSWARQQVMITGSKVNVKGKENIPDENVLFVSNHQGNFDIPLIMGYVSKPKGFVAKVGLEKMPIVSTWMREMKCIFLDRKNPRKSLKTILKGIELLKEGHTLTIFPEGTRSKGNEMGEFKKGSLKLATKSKVPIVPITLNGTYKILEQNKKITPSEIEIIIHKPIMTKDLTKEEESDLVERVYNIIKEPLM